MPSPLSDLRMTLSLKLLGYTEPHGSEPEAAQINFLCEMVDGYAMGDYDKSEVVEAFRQHPVPGFDILLWIKSKEDSGEWDPS